MDPKDLKLSNGVSCILIDDADKVIGVIVPEGWKVHVLATDSGQRLDVERRGMRASLLVTPAREEPAPSIVAPWKE